MGNSFRIDSSTFLPINGKKSIYHLFCHYPQYKFVTKLCNIPIHFYVDFFQMTG
jgi:hypothetical protein